MYDQVVLIDVHDIIHKLFNTRESTPDSSLRKGRGIISARDQLPAKFKKYSIQNRTRLLPERTTEVNLLLYNSSPS